MKKKELDDLLTLFPVAVAYCQLAKVFRPFVDRRQISFCAVLVIDAQYNIHHYREASEVLLLGKAANTVRRYNDRVIIRTVTSNEGGRYDHLIADAQDHKPVIFLFEHDVEVPAEFRVGADIYCSLGRPDVAACKAAVFQMCSSTVSDEDAEYLLDQHWRRTAAAFRRGRSAKRSLQMLRSNPPPNIAIAPSASAPPEQNSRRLEELAGFGEASRWGLQLASDIADYKNGKLGWEDVDRGVLLSGPPGVGKTKFAAALAATCEVPLIHGSVARWQEKGYLNDLLREMRKSFADASAAAPCVFLIDEVDAFGNRADKDQYNSNYHRQVISGLLECLDGIVRRQGVVVVGTANHPHLLDSALLRAGRLDRHIRVELPDEGARIAILELYLDTKIPREQADAIKVGTEEWSGADLELLARDARRRARLEGREVSADDVLAALPDTIVLAPDRLLTTALHEAGHAVVGLAVGRQIDRIKLADRLPKEFGTHKLGGVRFELGELPRRTREYYLDEIMVLLAGIAAETAIVGSHDDGVGGEPFTDLALATKYATMVEGVFAMGESLVSEVFETDEDLATLRFRNPLILRRVDALLNNQMREVTEIVLENLQVVEALAKEIANRRLMTGAEVSDFIGAGEWRITKPVHRADNANFVRRE